MSTSDKRNRNRVRSKISTATGNAVRKLTKLHMEARKEGLYPGEIGRLRITVDELSIYRDKNQNAIE